MKTNEIHIGSLIKQKVKEKSISVAEFARRINRSRSDIYYIYDCDIINIELLRTISNVLQYDFVAEQYEEINPINTEYEYVLISFLKQEELPDSIPENTILFKKQITK